MAEESDERQPTDGQPVDDLDLLDENESSSVEVDEVGAFVDSGGELAEDFDDPDPLGPTRGGGKAVRFPSGAALSAISGATGRDGKDWDPNGAGKDLLDTRDGTIKLANNFSVRELASSGATQFSPARIDTDLVCAVQALRDHVGKAVAVSSGYRSWAYNKELYRKRSQTPTRSRHCSGQAVDVKVTGLSGLAIAKAAVEACGTKIGVGIGDDFAHIDVRGNWTVWTYLSGSAATSAKSALEAHAKTVRAIDSDGLDLRRANLRNCALSSQLGWAEHRQKIADALGAPAAATDNVALAKAVAAWQRKKGLDVDGIIGPNTWKALDK